MPAGVANYPPSTANLPPAALPDLPVGVEAPLPPPGPPAGPPSGQVPGIPGAVGAPPPPPPREPHPSESRYWNETQADGSILIGSLGPEGQRGPVIQIVKPPKTAK